MFIFIGSKKRQSILSVILSFLCLAEVNAQQKYIFEQPKMGSPFTITIFSNDSSAAANAAIAAFKKVDSLNEILSDYIDQSEINRLSRSSGKGKYVQVSAPLFDILKRSVEAAQRSEGSFDITMGPIVQLWRSARKNNQLPAADSIQLALAKTGYKHIHLDNINQSVLLDKEGMRLDIGGIGKGYVANEALKVLKKSGFSQAMVNAGGKIVTGDAPGSANGWLIGINLPGEKNLLMPALLSLQNMAVATSGDLYQNLSINGKKYSHIINPKTGMGLTHGRNVTAIAQDAATADWLSTACSVLSVSKSIDLVEKIPGAALLITENKKGRIVQRSSTRFKDYFAD